MAVPAGARLLYVSCGDNGLFGLRLLLDRGHEVAAVVTIPPELGRRYAVAGYCDFAPFCAERALRVVTLDSYALSPAHLEGIGFDLIVVNGWNRLLPPEVLSLAPFGGLGVHAGHPPIGLGRAPLVWNIIKGRTDIEVYVFRLTPAADDGDIVCSQTVEITPHDDVRLLYEKVMLAGAMLFDRAARAIASGAGGIPQDLSAVVHYPKRTQEDGAIDFSGSEAQIHDFVRAQVPPYPGAHAMLDGQPWKVLQALPFDRFAFREVPRRPGTILCVLPAGVVVQTGGAAVWITAAEVDGRAVPAGGFDRLGLQAGQRFAPAVRKDDNEGTR